MKGIGIMDDNASKTDLLFRHVSKIGFSFAIFLFIASYFGEIDKFGFPTSSPYVELYFGGMAVYVVTAVVQFISRSCYGKLWVALLELVLSAVAFPIVLIAIWFLVP